MPSRSHENSLAGKPLFVTLPDGDRIGLRPLGPSDQERALEAFHRLSEESRFLRFFTNLKIPPEGLIEQLTKPDDVDHVAWFGWDPETPEDPGLGAASFWRDSSQITEAEFAITVADDHQGRGIGTLLLATLWILARQRGIESFRLVTLRENHPMIHWMQSLGAEVESSDSSERVFRIDLSPETEDALPSSPSGDLLAAWLAELTVSLREFSPESR